MVRVSEHAARMGEMRIAQKLPEEKTLLGRPRRRREDNIRMDVKESRCEGACWIHLTQDRDQ